MISVKARLVAKKTLCLAIPRYIKSGSDRLGKTPVAVADMPHET